MVRRRAAASAGRSLTVSNRVGRRPESNPLLRPASCISIAIHGRSRGRGSAQDALAEGRRAAERDVVHLARRRARADGAVARAPARAARRRARGVPALELARRRPVARALGAAARARDGRAHRADGRPRAARGRRARARDAHMQPPHAHRLDVPLVRVRAARPARRAQGHAQGLAAQAARLRLGDAGGPVRLPRARPRARPRAHRRRAAPRERVRAARVPARLPRGHRPLAEQRRALARVRARARPRAVRARADGLGSGG